MAVPTTKRKRARAPDYSEEEIAIIRNCFVRHNAVLSAKHSNDITQKKKDSIYDGIVTEVNAVGVAERSLSSIKDKWQTLKKNVKDKVASSVRIKRREREKTGGGENPTLDDPDVVEGLDEDEKDILQVIPAEQITGEFQICLRNRVGLLLCRHTLLARCQMGANIAV